MTHHWSPFSLFWRNICSGGVFCCCHCCRNSWSCRTWWVAPIAEVVVEPAPRMKSNTCSHTRFMQSHLLVSVVVVLVALVVSLVVSSVVVLQQWKKSTYVNYYSAKKCTMIKFWFLEELTSFTPQTSSLSSSINDRWRGQGWCWIRGFEMSLNFLHELLKMVIRFVEKVKRKKTQILNENISANMLWVWIYFDVKQQKPQAHLY